MSVCVSRRFVLGAGAGLLVAGAPRDIPSVFRPRHSAELFVFPAPDTGKSVLALVIAATGAGSALPMHMRIHADSRSWTVETPRSARAWNRDGDRFFVGQVIGGHGPMGARHDAVVVESPLREAVAAWAEVHPADGSRLRVGSPFVAELLARDPALSGIYHRASPAEDAALFTGALEKHLAALAVSGGGVADPEAHARRLAARLLPDVIPYRQDAPVGFSFASQNGRHPSDDADAVTATLLRGAVMPRKAAPPRFRLTSNFPYFPTVGV